MLRDLKRTLQAFSRRDDEPKLPTCPRTQGPGIWEIYEDFGRALNVATKVTGTNRIWNSYIRGGCPTPPPALVPDGARWQACRKPYLRWHPLAPGPAQSGFGFRSHTPKVRLPCFSTHHVRMAARHMRTVRDQSTPSQLPHRSTPKRTST